jgi:threonine aldolase
MAMSNTNRTFASDNAATVHPDIMQAIAAANIGHAVSYGSDPWTERATTTLRRVFGADCIVGFVYNGTGANVVGLQTALAGYHAVICSEVSHINVDECGSVERITGSKVIPIAHDNGCIAVASIEQQLHVMGVEHHSQPRVVSITQSTELGTVYSVEQIRAIADVCHANGLFLHVDGARICNAAAALQCDLSELTGEAGVDILSLGATKNGLMFGEAVVILRPELAESLLYVRKQTTQLASKMRFIAAQFDAMFAGDLWRHNAAHANAMAHSLQREIQAHPHLEVVYPVEANAVFVRMPHEIIAQVQEQVFFYVWDPAGAIVRLMCSFDTTDEDIERLLSAIDSALR